MKSVYVGKKVNGTTEIEICKVIDSDIASGNALVFNRKTKNFEEITLNERVILHPNIRKLAEDTPQDDYRLANLVRIYGELYVIRIKVNGRYLTRAVNKRIYNAIVSELRNRY